MFTFKIHKANETTREDFASALSCARVSIGSVLYDQGALVTEANDLITITAEGLTAHECYVKIQGCFRDRPDAVFEDDRRAADQERGRRQAIPGRSPAHLLPRVARPRDPWRCHPGRTRRTRGGRRPGGAPSGSVPGAVELS